MPAVEQKTISAFLRLEIERIRSSEPSAATEVARIQEILRASDELASVRQSCRRLQLELDEQESDFKKLDACAQALEAESAKLQAIHDAELKKRATTLLNARLEGKRLSVVPGVDTRSGLDERQAATDLAIAQRSDKQARVDKLRNSLVEQKRAALALRAKISEGAVMYLEHQFQIGLAELLAVYRLSGEKIGRLKPVHVEPTDEVYEPIYDRLRGELSDLIA